MDCGDEKQGDPIVVPYKILHRPVDHGVIVAGALGGALAAGAYEVSKAATAPVRDAKGIVGEHKLFIKKNDNFTIQGVNSKIDNLINFPVK